MTVLDTKIIPKVLTIVTKFGKNAVFTVIGLNQYDPETGDVIEAGPTTYTKKVTPPEKYEMRFVDGDLIQSGDLSVYLPASGLEFTPVRDMTVEFDNKNFQILEVEPIYSGEFIAIYKLQLRD